MFTITKMLVLAVAFVIQTVDPSGYWVGLINIPEMTLQIAVDIAKPAGGQRAATFSQPEQGVKGLPFSSVTVEGRTVRLVLKAGSDASEFEGTLSADGQELSGTATRAGMSAPFTLQRKGESRIAPAPRSAAITGQLEGTWHGALDVNGTTQRLILTMSNQPDGSAAGTVLSPDGTGVAIPIAMVEKGNTVTVNVPSVGASFAGTLDAAGAELTGTWTQSGMTLPVTFRRVRP